MSKPRGVHTQFTPMVDVSYESGYILVGELVDYSITFLLVVALAIGGDEFT